MMKPYNKSDINALCGIYSIVNATRIVRGLSEDASYDLFSRIVNYLENSRLLAKALTEGVVQGTIGKIFNEVVNVSESTQVKKLMPFRLDSNIEFEEMWVAMKNFLDEGDNRAILIGIGGKYLHWTVIKSMTKSKINLFDSDGLKVLHKSRCYTNVNIQDNGLHFLSPTHTYFLS